MVTDLSPPLLSLLLSCHLFVNDAVTEFCELSTVPTACCTHKVACDSLELIDILAAAVRTLLEACLCVLESAVHATVAVVVH